MTTTTFLQMVTDDHNAATAAYCAARAALEAARIEMANTWQALTLATVHAAK